MLFKTCVCYVSRSILQMFLNITYLMKPHASTRIELERSALREEYANSIVYFQTLKGNYLMCVPGMGLYDSIIRKGRVDRDDHSSLINESVQRRDTLHSGGNGEMYEANKTLARAILTLILKRNLIERELETFPIESGLYYLRCIQRVNDMWTGFCAIFE